MEKGQITAIRNCDLGAFVSFPEIPGKWQIASIPYHNEPVFGDRCVINVWCENLNGYFVVEDEKEIIVENPKWSHVPKDVIHSEKFNDRRNLIIDWGEAF